MDWYIYFTLALALIIIYVVFGRKKPERKGKPAPGPKGSPIIGYAGHLSKAPLHEVLHELADQYGDIVQFYIFGKSFIVLNSMEKIRAAFATEPYSKFMNDRVETFFGRWLFFDSQGIAFMLKAHDSPHSEMRKVFAKGMKFFGEGRGDFEQVVQGELKNIVQTIEELGGKDFNMKETLKRSLSNIISIELTGAGLPDGDKDMFWDFLRNGQYLLRQDVDILLSTFPFLRWSPFYKAGCDKVETSTEIILKRYYHDVRATHNPDAPPRGLVDFLINEQLQAEREGREVLLTDDKIKVTVLETIGAGINNLQGVLCTMFLLLIDHPECQAKIQAELDRVVGRDDLPGLSHRRACPYTEAFFFEAQRYIPVATTNAIHCCYSNIEFEGYDIPAKSIIVPNLWSIHHSKEIWGDPWVFRPERWLDENGQLLPNDSLERKHWLAFGTGRRQCAGESMARSRMFLYLATFMQRWRLELGTDETPKSSDPRGSDFETGLIIEPKPYRCRVVPRSR